MSRVRTYTVGRERSCDVRLDDSSVSRRHAEVVRVSAGRLHVTDCATTNGTFVLNSGAWRAIRQQLVEPTDHIRFGDYEMRVDQLDARCPHDVASPSGDGNASHGDAGSPPAGEDVLDLAQGLERIPETGELIQKEPRRRQ